MWWNDTQYRYTCRYTQYHNKIMSLLYSHPCSYLQCNVIHNTYMCNTCIRYSAQQSVLQSLTSHTEHPKEVNLRSFIWRHWWHLPRFGTTTTIAHTNILGFTIHYTYLTNRALGLTYCRIPTITVLVTLYMKSELILRLNLTIIWALRKTLVTERTSLQSWNSTPSDTYSYLLVA